MSLIALPLSLHSLQWCLYLAWLPVMSVSFMASGDVCILHGLRWCLYLAWLPVMSVSSMASSDVCILHGFQRCLYFAWLPVMFVSCMASSDVSILHGFQWCLFQKATNDGVAHSQPSSNFSGRNSLLVPSYSPATVHCWQDASWRHVCLCPVITPYLYSFFSKLTWEELKIVIAFMCTMHTFAAIVLRQLKTLKLCVHFWQIWLIVARDSTRLLNSNVD